MGIVKKTARRIGVSLIGFPLLVIGIVLVPLPGPGLVTCFVAFLVLSLEFNWAEKQLDKAKREIRRIYVRAKARADRIGNMGEPKK